MLVPGRIELDLKRVMGVVWRPVGDDDVLRQSSVIKECVRFNEYQALFGLKGSEGGEGEEFLSQLYPLKRENKCLREDASRMPCLGCVLTKLDASRQTRYRLR